jgi:tRNA(Ile)-lysidine synthase
MMEDVETEIQKCWDIDRWRDVTVLLAISGGADSVALLLAMRRLAPEHSGLAVAHFNHGLRGDESDADAAFVGALAEQQTMRFFVNAAPPQVKAMPQDEERLRKQRYDFLEKTSRSIGARYVVTAHHQNDVAETLLLNLIRGTGLAGLSGIEPFRPIDHASDVILARPMLNVSRSFIQAYLERHQQAYRIDSSNTSSRYKRNRIRNEVLPLMAEINGGSTTESIARSVTHLSHVNRFLDSLAATVREEAMIDATPQHCVLNYDRLANEEWILVQRALVQIWTNQQWSLQQMSQAAWFSIRNYLTEEQSSPSAMLPGRLRLRLQETCERNSGNQRPVELWIEVIE